MIFVRKAKSEDVKAICKINAEVMGYSYPREETQNKLCMLMENLGHGIFVAEYDGAAVGYIHLHDYDCLYFPHMKNVLCLAVLPEFRRKGIASALLRAGECWAEGTGAAGIRLDSGAERLPAHGCYEKAGYVQMKMHRYFRKMF